MPRIAEFFRTIAHAIATVIHTIAHAIVAVVTLPFRLVAQLFRKRKH